MLDTAATPVPDDFPRQMSAWYMRPLIHCARSSEEAARTVRWTGGHEMRKQLGPWTSMATGSTFVTSHSGSTTVGLLVTDLEYQSVPRCSSTEK